MFLNCGREKASVCLILDGHRFKYLLRSASSLATDLLFYEGPGIDEGPQLLQAFLEVIVQNLFVRYLVL